MEEGNRRVIKNTLYLYLRQVIVLILGLVTTRIVLEKLGVDNYGIYTVVGSFVSLFMILNSVLQSATRRFLSLSIGKNYSHLIRQTFQTSVVLHIGITLVAVVLLESLGLWFLNHELNIESSRLWAANIVFHLSVFTVGVNILNTPYIAAITSYERFDVYAYISLFDVIAKIAMLFLLVVLPFDKLIVYSALSTFVTSTSAAIYVFFCRKNFDETRQLSFHPDKRLLKEMVKFSGWDSFGNISSIANAQGITILINIFFGTVVNAARGLAGTVTYTVQQFVSNFIVAAEPQLVKSYANGEFDRMKNLVFNISQMTLFMLAVFAVPIWLEMEYVLRLWLGDNVPEYTGIFIKITILNCFISYSSLMVVKAIVATGNVKELNLRLAPIELLILPAVYVVLKLGGSPVAIYIVCLIPSFLKFLVNNHLLHRYIGFPSWEYFIKVFVRNLLLVGIATILPLLCRIYMDEGIVRFLVVGSVSVLCTLLAMWMFALNSSLKTQILQRVGFK